MTSRNYDVILKVSNAFNFQTSNTIIGNTSLTVGYIAYADKANNILKVKLANSQQEFSATEAIHSNIITTTGSANGSLNTTSLPFQANVFNIGVTTATATISSISPSSFIAEKNAFTQNPIVRLYSIYYPGEWYPPNAAGNPTGPGTGYAWPSIFPLRLAEIIGDTADDISYNVTYNGISYIPYPMNITGLEQASDGRVNELSLSVFNTDNLISVLVENPYLAGLNISNSISAIVNGELVGGIDPRTVGANAASNTATVAYYGKQNAPFDKTQTELVGGIWQPQKTDTRDLLGGVVELKTTFANFLDYWPEYSKVTSVSSNVVSVINAMAYRVGDTVMLSDNTYASATVQYLDSNQNLYLNKPITKYLPLATRDSSMQGMTFKPDGTKLYMAGLTNDRVYEYNLPNTWDISTATYLEQFSIASQETAVRGIRFDTTGTYMFIIGSTSDNIYRYTLSTAWNVTTATLSQTFNIAPYEINTTGLGFDTTGTNAYIIGTTNGKVIQFKLTTGWDLTTASYLQNTSIATQDANASDLFFKPDGTKLYIIGQTGDKIYQYNLASAWNVATATYSANTYIRDSESNPTMLSLSQDGSNVYFAGTTMSNLHQVPLTTAWDITSVNYSLPVGSPLYIANPQADTESYLQDVYKIDQLESLSEQVASFSLVSWLQYFKIVTPKRKYYKNTCQWVYKGPECQYPGPGGGTIPGTTLLANTDPITANNTVAVSNLGDVCAKSLAACKLRNNSIHYGGFPGVGRTVPQM